MKNDSCLEIKLDRSDCQRLGQLLRNTSKWRFSYHTKFEPRRAMHTGRQRVFKQSEEFINENSERQFLSSWLSWWDNHRTFIFGAFAPTNAPRMNQAEVIHAGWAHKDLSNLSLLDAAHTDTRDSMLLTVESIEQGTSKGGTGPSYEERKTRQLAKENNRSLKMSSHQTFMHFLV